MFQEVLSNLTSLIINYVSDTTNTESNYIFFEDIQRKDNVYKIKLENLFDTIYLK